MINEQKEKHVYTVSELTKFIRVILEDSFPGIWVEGEISNFVLHSSGHMYFSLRDAGSTLKCAMFKRANEKLKFKPKDGMKIICFGSISVYEARGDYQLIVEEIEPKGVGALQLQFQQLKEKLQKEGLFDEKYKTPIPFLPTRIGVVTSPTGAAIRDILNIARRRFSNVEIIINPVKVQGVDAKDEIAAAIRQFNKLKNIDVMVVARGGGSLEDLWPFNEEVVARAIFESEIPVISAVGHEIDFTISDFVADFRAPTPSAAAELVIPKKEDLINLINKETARLNKAISGKLEWLEERLRNLKEAYIFRQPLNYMIQQEQRIDDLRKDMHVRIVHVVGIYGEKFNRVISKLEALSPVAILKRGYSITVKWPEGAIVKDANALKKDDIVETKLGRGKFKSRVEEIE
ncbi:MAG: exodeoxyribonuclease VII large subunit [Omnitrophica bacterium RIFCSPLOWO2_02_FULL_45_16]|nr:MAG: exodeoxyribonuclease VII large subunit [Omnitrophica bacterium RIFCSPLOWO2_02_FULL_45_16]